LIPLFRPTSAHLHSLLPPRKLPILLLRRDLWRERLDARCVDVLELVEGLPDADGEAGCDCGAEGSGFEHAGPLDGDAD